MYKLTQHYNLYFKEDFMDLCSTLHQEIIERNTPYKYNKVLVRYIDYEGSFGYVRFGNFFFVGEKLIVITSEERYSNLHNSLYNTTSSGGKMRDDDRSYFIEVIYAGVFTGFIDDYGKPIFEGDLVDAGGGDLFMSRYYAAVSISDGNYSSILDNHSVPLYKAHSIIVIGNIFFDLKLSDSDTFNIRGASNIWCDFQYGTKESVQELLAKCASAPYFSIEVDS